MTAAPLALLLLFAPPDWVDRARSAPPEFAARLLLKGAAETRDRTQRAALIEEAFAFATRAAVPWQLLTVAPPDSLANRRASAGNEHMDALSLERQAIDAMLNVDPARAQQLALSLPVPTPEPAKCSDSTAARLDDYYGIVLTMASRGFTAKQRQDGRHLSYLIGVLAASTSPGQLFGAVQLVAAYPAADANESQALIAALAASLRASPPNPRAWSLVPSLADELKSLRRRANSPDLDLAAEAFLKTQSDAEPCTAPDYGLLFNSGEARQLRQALQLLRRQADQSTADWSASFKSLLSQVDSWREEVGASDLALFHMRALSYTALLDVASTDEQLTSVLGSFIPFLRDTPAKQTVPGEWLIHFRRAVAPRAPGGVRSTAIALNEIRRSGDMLMNLLAEAGETR